MSGSDGDVAVDALRTLQAEPNSAKMGVHLSGRRERDERLRLKSYRNKRGKNMRPKGSGAHGMWI